MDFFVTGSTGFLGQYLVSELLSRGHTVWAMYRDEEKRALTLEFLESQGCEKGSGRLMWLKGEILQVDDLWDRWRQAHPALEAVNHIVHTAASLRFTVNEAGDPFRTNVGGSEALRKLVERHPMQVHLISTAYVSGLATAGVVREVFHPRGEFTNVYEQSKWEAEQVWQEKATILRPSSIVGDSMTGRCSQFLGWYLPVKALHLLDGLLANSPDSGGDGFEIKVPADPRSRVNIIPVDYVAKAAVRIIENPAHHNGIFHLTHSSPPTYEWTHDVFSRRFKRISIKFVGPGTEIGEPRTEFHRMLLDHTQRILPYLLNTPEFDRNNTDRAVPEVEEPSITEAYLNLLIDYAVRANWGRSTGPSGSPHNRRQT